MKDETASMIFQTGKQLNELGDTIPTDHEIRILS
jgi:hypothetical protein